MTGIQGEYFHLFQKQYKCIAIYERTVMHGLRFGWTNTRGRPFETLPSSFIQPCVSLPNFSIREYIYNVQLSACDTLKVPHKAMDSKIVSCLLSAYLVSQSHVQSDPLHMCERGSGNISCHMGWGCSPISELKSDYDCA